MDSESIRGQSNGGLAPLLGEYRVDSDGDVSVGMYDRPLRCCGCGIGWCSFIFGFLCPLFWYYGTFLFFAEHYRHDPRERPGLAACAIAALVCTVAAAITLIVLLADGKL
ncbi:hypothetical protein MPTK1_8g07890 [Marchantia polymorpha subsp. ruderalis]|uniref:60S ribosomal protein L18a-like protein n=1 Tax=Marchantia polymorpha TaxID=3197 RepID=A0A2R6W4H6_MARPO|nr:hypothetical protein MARPO_0155s0028 [Marchantia polymorpha]BBN19105.1 hypothetical protein Mp_8g07890 [Marchantia polymorpha subsp. ruderalis]|eukprot:PTQ28766.1 hypothetical protein MARPO_0155s0028 [Marchantia polymorpha]